MAELICGSCGYGEDAHEQCGGKCPKDEALYDGEGNRVNVPGSPKSEPMVNWPKDWTLEQRGEYAAWAMGEIPKPEWLAAFEPTGGTYQFSIGGKKTKPLAHDASPEEQTAALAAITQGGVKQKCPKRNPKALTVPCVMDLDHAGACSWDRSKREDPEQAVKRNPKRRVAQGLPATCAACEEASGDYCIDCLAIIDPNHPRFRERAELELVKLSAEQVLAYMGMIVDSDCITHESEAAMSGASCETLLKDPTGANRASMVCFTPTRQRFKVWAEEIYDAPEGLSEEEELDCQNWAAELASPGVSWDVLPLDPGSEFGQVVEKVGKVGEMASKGFLLPLRIPVAERLTALANERSARLKQAFNALEQEAIAQDDKGETYPIPEAIRIIESTC